MRFASRRFPYSGTFLDIGCGEGANARELADRGNRVFSIDVDPNVGPPIAETKGWHFCEDIRNFPFKGQVFDLIYDVNALCHVKDPPFEKIKNALKPEGIFFSIWPTVSAPDYVGDGKEFTHLTTLWEMDKMLHPFFPVVHIFNRNEPDFKGHQLDSWIIEAKL